MFKLVISLALLMFQIDTAVPAALDGKYCRLNDGMSRCVDPPLMVDDEDLWCPYHVCAEGYIAAPQCPPSEIQADTKCREVVIDEPSYRCLEGRTHVMTKLPVNCNPEVEGSCTSEVRTCACVQFAPTRVVLERIAPITPICE